MEKAFNTASVLLDNMNAKKIAPVVYCMNTDYIAPTNNLEAMENTMQIALLFNGFTES